MNSIYSQKRPNNLNTIVIMALVLFSIFYSVLPTFFLSELFPESASVLSNITIISNIGLIIGCYYWVLIDAKNSKKILLNYEPTLKFFFGLFITFLAITVATSDGVPILAALRGADNAEIAVLREKFFKAREGWQSILPYINAVLSGSIIPYLIVLAFPRKYKYRYHLAFIFFIYCVSFSEKAYFLKIALPLFFYFYAVAKNKKMVLFVGTFSMFILLSVMTMISNYEYEEGNSNPFFSMQYEPENPLEKTLWRSLVVPVITANDAIRTFQIDYRGQYLYGSSSGFISSIFGLERVRFERDVFRLQFGLEWEGTASSNSFYVTEAYVNFGMWGVFVFGLIVGWTLFFFIKTTDIALQGMSLLFLYTIFNSSLISTFMSSGYIFVIIWVSFFKFKESLD